LLLDSHKAPWLEILEIGDPAGHEIAPFVLEVCEAASDSRWTCYCVEESWHEAWYGVAGYDRWKTPTETESQAKMRILTTALSNVAAAQGCRVLEPG